MQRRSSKVIFNRIYISSFETRLWGLKWGISVSLPMTQQERKFELKLEFSKHFETKTLQIRRDLKLEFGLFPKTQNQTKSTSV